MSARLSPLDATFLELEEADEAAHMHIGMVMVFESGPDGVPTPAALTSHLQARLGLLPRYHERLSSPHTGGLRWPSWEADPNFALASHLRRAVLPAPGGEAELLEWAGDYWSRRLDRRRPLWDAVLLEGLEGGRWGIATKIHHAMVDGVGSVDIGQLLVDTSRARSRRTAAPLEKAVSASPSGPDHQLAAWLVGAVRGGVDSVLHPRKALTRSKAVAGLVLDELLPAPVTSLNSPLSTLRIYRVVHVRLAAVKRIKNGLGGTVNDVFLAAATGGLRRLLGSRGERLPRSALRAMVPVNVRADSDRGTLGNRVSSLFVDLPVAEPDALRRYELIQSEAEALKAGGQAKGSSALLTVAGLAPPLLHAVVARAAFGTRLFNLTITNVPGPQRPLYAFGSRLEQVLPLVPLAADHTLGIAVVSYAGGVTFGLNGDATAAADLDVLAAGIEDSLSELSALARRRSRKPAPPSPRTRRRRAGADARPARPGSG